jgi:hypothetical protein
MMRGPLTSDLGILVPDAHKLGGDAHPCHAAAVLCDVRSATPASCGGAQLLCRSQAEDRGITAITILSDGAWQSLG